MRIFDREGYDLDGIDRRGCYLFDLGSKVNGQSVSTGTQSVSAQFIPSVNINNDPALVSPYPVGQGLSTINTALPGSAAYLPATYASTTATTTSTSLTTWLLIAALGVGAWFLLRKKR